MKTLIDMAAGLAGGLLGTALMQGLAKAGRKLPSSFQARFKGDPAEFIVSRGEKLTHHPLSSSTRDKIKPALPFAYGLTGPLVLGALAPRIGRGSVGRILAAGAIMGATVWAVGYLGWMPLGGVIEPIHRQPVPATAQALVGHALYGLVAAAPVALTERFIEA
jgi:hypothetical protein